MNHLESIVAIKEAPKTYGKHRSNMQAVLLAAGCGKRMGTALNGRPKCLADIGGETLIERQLKTLKDLEIDRVCVVLGYRQEEFLPLIGDRCEFIVNNIYHRTNSLYSLWLARNWVSGPFILLNGDVLAHPDVYRRVLASGGNALAYDSSSGNDEEHMKVAVQGHLVWSIGKELPQEETHGENVGILKFGKRGAEQLFNEADKLVRTGAQNYWVPAAVSSLAKRVSIQAVDAADLPWTEIDFPEDLTRAREVISPLIARQSVSGNSFVAEATNKEQKA